MATLLSAMLQEHERGLGGWQAEWETLPELFRLSAGSLARMAEAAEGLKVDAVRMRANLDAARGLPMAEAVSTALAVRIGRAQAHECVQVASLRALDRGVGLGEALRGDPAVVGVLGEGAIAELLDPAGYLGSADAFIDAVLGRDAADG